MANKPAKPATPGSPPPPVESTHDPKESREWLRVTQSDTGDAIVITDAQGRVSFLNPVIIDTMRQPFLVLDRALRVIAGNRSFYQTFGVEKSDTEGRFVYDLGDGQWNIPQLRLLLEEILPQQQALDDFEVEHDFEGIGKKVMLLNARRVSTEGGYQSGERREVILLAIEDVTEKRAAVQNLHDSELRYRRLFQTAKDGILILDAHTGKIIDANAFMSALVGLEPHDLLGKELYQIGMYGDIEENKEAFRELQRNRYLRQDHLPVQNQRGEKVEVEFIANVYHEDHTLVAQCNVRDISERIAMETRINQQTQELANESRRKDEFLAMLSHELRNPLAPLRSAVHLLKMHDRGTDTPSQKQARDIIERQVGNLTKLVSDLLEVSRLVTGRIHLDRQVLDLNNVLRHAIETVDPLIQQRKHKLVLHLCSDPIWADADATRMEEVFINLLNNAAKYTPDGGTIEVHCEHPEGTNLAQVRVRDNGVGIEQELLPRIFDLFSQADRSLARSSGGLGIGLSLAHRIVELHGGSIEAKSPPEGAQAGTELIVRLTLTRAPVGSAHAQVHPPDSGTPQRPDGRRVLVVDDNFDLVSMLASALHLNGHSVQSAHNGHDGLRIAQQWKPEVILLDIGLPGLDGYEVARRLRADDGMKDTRLIAITGYGRDTDLALAREAGFDAHMIKPCDFDELEKLITAPANAPR